MLRDLLIKDLGWKLFSVFLAIAIWFIANRILHESGATTDANTTTTLSYNALPVSLVSSSGNLSGLEIAPTTVKVTVSGPQDIMHQLQIGSLHATVNLYDTNIAHDKRLPVEISAPLHITILSVEPAQVWVISPASPGYSVPETKP
jgi:YbbR domain-containing protein